MRNVVETAFDIEFEGERIKPLLGFGVLVLPLDAAEGG